MISEQEVHEPVGEDNERVPEIHANYNMLLHFGLFPFSISFPLKLILKCNYLD